MGDRVLRIQDDFETMQRLMNELEYEKKQYEKEIEKETQLIAELDCKTEAAKQEDKLNKEAVKQQDEEAKLLNSQCVQNMQSYNSLQEACDILSEQEKNLSISLRELWNRDETARAKKRATVDHYEAIYKSYKEKYENYPLAVQRKLKEEELASWEENYKEATRMAEETAKKLICLEAAVSQKAATSVNDFPIFKSQNEFIIRLAEMKLTFDELSSELERKTRCYKELKKAAGEKVKAKRQMDEEKKKDELKRNAEERNSDERNIAEKRMRAEEVQKREEKNQLSLEELRRKMEKTQMEDTRLRRQNQALSSQIPSQRDAFRPETTNASQTAALQATTAFHQRLPPKIFLPARQMSFQQNSFQQNNQVGVFKPPLPPKDLRHPLAVTGKQLPCLEASVAIGTLVPRSEATTPIAAGLNLDAFVATPIPVPSKQPRVCLGKPVVLATRVQPQQPLSLETPVGVTGQPKQPSCSETSAGITVLSMEDLGPEAGGGIASCLESLSIRGQTEQSFFMDTEDGLGFSSYPHADSNSIMHSGFDQRSDIGAGDDQGNFMSSSAAAIHEEEEANQETRGEENTVSRETLMATDQDEQSPSLEAVASAASFICPEVAVTVSHTKSSSRLLQMNSAVGSSDYYAMHDDPVSRSMNADCASSSITRGVSLPSDIYSSSPGLSRSPASEVVEINDCPTLAVTSSTTTCPATMMPSDVSLYCPTSEETTATSVTASVSLDRPTTSLYAAAAESEFYSEDGASNDLAKSFEQPSGWDICGSKTPAIPTAENTASGKCFGTPPAATEFSFEEEMAKLRRLSESPAVNLYSGRRMFGLSEGVDKSATVHESGGNTSFMRNFEQFESDCQKKESDKAANADSGFGNFFSFGGDRSDSNEIFSFFDSRGTESENSSTRVKDGATTSDNIFKLFGGSDAENTTSRQKETGGDGSGDIFNMFASGGSATATSSKDKRDDDAGGFFNFGAKQVGKNSPVKSKFSLF